MYNLTSCTETCRCASVFFLSARRQLLGRSLSRCTFPNAGRTPPSPWPTPHGARGPQYLPRAAWKPPGPSAVGWALTKLPLCQGRREGCCLFWTLNSRVPGPQACGRPLVGTGAKGSGQDSSVSCQGRPFPGVLTRVTCPVDVGDASCLHPRLILEEGPVGKCQGQQNVWHGVPLPRIQRLPPPHPAVNLGPV